MPVESELSEKGKNCNEPDGCIYKISNTKPAGEGDIH